jgi:hypothetical protein
VLLQRQAQIAPPVVVVAAIHGEHTAWLSLQACTGDARERDCARVRVGKVFEVRPEDVQEAQVFLLEENTRERLLDERTAAATRTAQRRYLGRIERPAAVRDGRDRDVVCEIQEVIRHHAFAHRLHEVRDGRGAGEQIQC